MHRTTFSRSIRGATRAFVLATAGVLVLTTGAVSAKPNTSITIVRTSACHYTVTFSWTGMGHGSELMARVQLFGVEGGNSALIDQTSQFPVSGREGQLQYAFVSTESFPFQYRGFGFLQTTRGQELVKSETSSDVVPASPEACGA